MCCFFEVAMFVFGIITLTKGQFTLSKNRVVTGAPAYTIGAILTATLPILVMLGLTIGIIFGVLNPEAAMRGDQNWTFYLIDFIGVPLALLIVFLLATIYGHDPHAPVAAMYSNSYSLPPTAPPPADPHNPYNPPYSG